MDLAESQCSDGVHHYTMLFLYFDVQQQLTRADNSFHFQNFMDCLRYCSLVLCLLYVCSPRILRPFPNGIQMIWKFLHDAYCTWKWGPLYHNTFLLFNITCSLHFMYHIHVHVGKQRRHGLQARNLIPDNMVHVHALYVHTCSLHILPSDRTAHLFWEGVLCGLDIVYCHIHLWILEGGEN